MRFLAMEIENQDDEVNQPYASCAAAKMSKWSGRVVTVVAMFVLAYVTMGFLSSLRSSAGVQQSTNVPISNKGPIGTKTTENNQQQQQQQQQPPPELNQQQQQQQPKAGSRTILGQSPTNAPSVRQTVVDAYVDRYSLQWNASLDDVWPWKVAADWVTERQVLPDLAPRLGTVLRAMATAPITAVEPGSLGSQLKLEFILKGGQRVVFKPKRYERDHVTPGSSSGSDRHNGEIASFHLNRLMGFGKSPLVVGRTVNLKAEIMPAITDINLTKTFYKRGGNLCTHGICKHCTKATGVCASGVAMEGSLTLWLPTKWQMRKLEHPWWFMYFSPDALRWTMSDTFCSSGWLSAKGVSNGDVLLADIFDTAIFDFLISNTDRHHIETFTDVDQYMFLNLDNGKSFGNPRRDERLLLAPVQQCCKLRKSTWDRIQHLKDGALSEVLRKVLARDPVSPILTYPHYIALDRRLKYVENLMLSCVEKKGASEVFIND